jgi:hypothetical protein
MDDKISFLIFATLSFGAVKMILSFSIFRSYELAKNPVLLSLEGLSQSCRQSDNFNRYATGAFAGSIFLLLKQ